MGLKIQSIILSVFIASINAQVCQQSVSTLLQNILANPNANRALQILRNSANAKLNPDYINSQYGFVEEIVPCNNQILTSGPVQNIPRYVANAPRPINYLPNVTPNIVGQVGQLPNGKFVPALPAGNFVLPAGNFAPALPSGNLLPVGGFPRIVGGCGCNSQFPSPNPFLPAQSPVSGMVPPTSNLLPPASTSKNRYLRKIPLPPPTL